MAAILIPAFRPAVFVKRWSRPKKQIDRSLIGPE